MKLVELAKKTRTITVEYLGELAEVEYKLAAITPEFFENMKNFSGLDSVIFQLTQIIVRWDITGEDNLEIPIDDEAIRKNGIPARLLNQVLLDVINDMNAWNEQEKKD